MENRRAGELIGAIVVFFVALFIYTKIVGPIAFTVNNINTLNPNPFEVQGTGKAAAAPDEALINLGVTANGTTVEEAQNKTNQSVTKIINSLKSRGISEKNIKTTNYSVSPNYNFLGENQKITGYSVTQNFELNCPIDRANEVVDAATANGANLVGGISFTLAEEKEEALKNEARKEAVDKAKASAEGLAKASGIKLGKIVNIQESFGSPQPMPVEVGVRALTDEKVPTQITPGESNVEVTVTLTYQTL